MSMAYRIVTPRPKRRRTVLSRRWVDMQQRCRGGSTKRPDLYDGLCLGFANFDEFRTFALTNGFSKANDSPDRKDTTKGYVPGNIRFVPARHNSLRALYPEEPRYDDDVPF